MLEKDKNCIEFSMSSMMVTHKPYQEDIEIAIEGMAPGKNLLLANNPFDIPCDVVVVSKRYFERLQTENEELINSLKRKAKFTDSNWQGVTGFSTPEKCSSYIDRLEKKLEDIKNLTEED